MSETIPTASREQIARHLHRVGQLAAAFSSMLPSGRLPSIEVLTLLHQAAALALQADFQLSAPPKITVTIIRRVSDGTELTDFVEVRDGERWQAADGVEHVEKHGHRLLAAKAVSKVLIPSEPDGARAIKLPLADETGAVEAIRHDGEIIRIICKEGHA